MTTLLDVRDLTVTYRQGAAVMRAVDRVSLSVEPGSVTLLVGPNGAGKSTLLRAIAGLEVVAGGTIHFEGQDVTAEPAARRLARGIAYCPSERRVFPGLTVLENLVVAAPRDRALRDQYLAAIWEFFPALQPLAQQRAWRLSGGQQQMVAIARTLMTGPRLLLLDEPLAGLAPGLMQTLVAHFAHLGRVGLTILIADLTHAPYAGLSGRNLGMGRGALMYSMKD